MPPTTWGADFTGCGNTDPDHSWYGGLIELDGGRDDGWLETPAGRSPDDTYPIGYYTESSLPVLGALARSYTALDGYFCALLAETFPNRLYMHAAQTDRDHNLNPPGFGAPPYKLATIPTIWDRLAGAGLSHRYYYRQRPRRLQRAPGPGARLPAARVPGPVRGRVSLLSLGPGARRSVQAHVHPADDRVAVGAAAAHHARPEGQEPRRGPRLRPDEHRARQRPAPFVPQGCP